ncbi:conserved hypothetical protein [Candida dubliniensis CD36]|uniref:Genetic interactor of prohibitin 5, mitochondrial n=1 Tax=Candida dubliniensis (strain CD36 / ATCC MYA-646 / CBS 7987 / NCPF 3949 / NRRL Y-17841) TaxID=573826 RepID=B9WGV2_CANDC|nr:conserved hypothetical protein [Candida dubliniensis CD36]CAX41390.1 conserved hypothetical protein [Candida dubliniensis CD36]
MNKHLQRQLKGLPQQIITDGLHALQHNPARFTSFHDIPQLLDYIYKPNKPAWWIRFMKCPYYNLKGKWPTIHLIDELGVDTSGYYNHQNLLSGSTPRPTLPLIKSYANQKDTTTTMIKEVEKLYKFILSKRGLFGVTNHPMEVIYTPSKLGKIHTPAVLDKELKNKVKLIKRVFNDVQPIEKPTLDKLQSIVVSQPHDSILQQYMARQFYLQNGKYILNSNY